MGTIDLKILRRRAPVMLKAARHDLEGAARFGRDAPRFRQLVHVRTAQLTTMLDEPFRTMLAGRSGEVLDGDWDLCVVEADTPKIRACVSHWVHDVPWSDTDVYQLALEQIHAAGGVYDGCRNLDDVERRYARLDAVFEQVRREGRLRPRRELDIYTYREAGGVVVHIGRDAEPIWGRDGSHRIAMARSLDLPWIPCQIGVVHRAALRSWRTTAVPGDAPPFQDPPP